MIRQCSILEGTIKNLSESPLKALQGNQAVVSGYHFGVVVSGGAAALPLIQLLSAVAGSEEIDGYAANGAIQEVTYTNAVPARPKSWLVQWVDTGNNAPATINCNITGEVFGFYTLGALYIYGSGDILYGTVAIHHCTNGAVNDYNVDWSGKNYGPPSFKHFLNGFLGPGYYECIAPPGSVAVFWIGLTEAQVPSNFTMAAKSVRQVPTHWNH